MTSQRIDFCGIVGNTHVLDANGVRWRFGISTGWDSPEQDVEVGAATGLPGGVLLSDDIGPRRPVLEGTAKAPNRAISDEVVQTIRAKMPPAGGTGDLIVYEEVPKRATVRRAARPRYRRETFLLTTFELELVALDPYIRALTPRPAVSIAAGTTQDVTNGGTAPAYLRIVTTSPGTVNVRQTGTGQVLRSKPGVTVAAGTVFDCARKRVESSGGVQLTGVLDNPSEWLAIPAESTVPVQNQGTAPVDVIVFDTY